MCGLSLWDIAMSVGVPEFACIDADFDIGCDHACEADDVECEVGGEGEVFEWFVVRAVGDVGAVEVDLEAVDVGVIVEALCGGGGSCGDEDNGDAGCGDVVDGVGDGLAHGAVVFEECTVDIEGHEFDLVGGGGVLQCGAESAIRNR